MSTLFTLRQNFIGIPKVKCKEILVISKDKSLPSAIHQKEYRNMKILFAKQRKNKAE